MIYEYEMLSQSRSIPLVTLNAGCHCENPEFVEGDEAISGDCRAHCVRSQRHNREFSALNACFDTPLPRYSITPIPGYSQCSLDIQVNTYIIEHALFSNRSISGLWGWLQYAGSRIQRFEFRRCIFTIYQSPFPVSRCMYRCSNILFLSWEFSL